jgi:Holliday junction resolvase RusA-like endonuclease
MIQLRLIGHVPGKKNRLMPRRDGQGYFNPRGTKKEIDALVWQIKAQYKGIPYVCPAIKAVFYVSSIRGDLDNKYTTIQDCLVTAGVLVNDNIKNLRGPIRIEAVPSDTDLTVISIGNQDYGESCD